MNARIEYVPGEAWCVAAGRVVLVCERDLSAPRAAALHAEAAAVDSLETLRALAESEPTALLALVDLDGRRALLRRHGVPAAAQESALPDRYGEAWSLDELDAAQPIAAGGLGALDGPALPLEAGVVRVAAVRIAPRRADATAHDAVDAPGAEAVATEPRAGAFGQTVPPREAAEARAAAGPAPAPGPTPGPAAEPAADAPLVDEPAAPAPAAAPATAEPEAAPASPRDESPVPSDTGNPIGGLIDSVPGFIEPAFDVRTAPPAAPAPSATPASAPPASAPPAPAPPASGSAASAPPASAELGDHDGMTVTADQARELLAASGHAGAQPAGTAAAEGPPATGPLVLSTICPAGHVNAPGSQRCTHCGAVVDESSAAQRRRPEVAVVVLPTGERVPLGRGVVIGRRPRSRRVEDGRVPRLVTVESPSEDISRSHLELRVEDWNLVAIDLSSTNGTLLLQEGAVPQRLRPEASTILQLGDRLDLGDGVVVAIEPAP
ncbi:FHA domain-containing protein [Agrococcus baldri]|uniref:FHA domain-containing protein n=1 Tax=Agrococcus baldri TaxID=153730 RepID=A0AA87UWW9_9MICO|nr:FHA domain-containing protein [Agrococcus baldri]GEK79787.1 hypothetical protein ABA31_11380 [Agrococcus baldri]